MLVFLSKIGRKTSKKEGKIPEIPTFYDKRL
jgi:hypothetical protein